jgi:hypothetical protein
MSFIKTAESELWESRSTPTLSISYCVAIPFLKLIMVASADCCLHATRKSEQRTWILKVLSVRVK